MRMTGAGLGALGFTLLWASGLAAASQEDAPHGYRIAQELLVGDGTVLEVLEDRRITAQLHAQSWGSGLDEETFDESTDSEHQPQLEARVRLVSEVGEVLAEQSLGYPLAKVEKAPLSGLPYPAFSSPSIRRLQWAAIAARPRRSWLRPKAAWSPYCIGTKTGSSARWRWPRPARRPGRSFHRHRGLLSRSPRCLRRLPARVTIL